MRSARRVAAALAAGILTITAVVPAAAEDPLGAGTQLEDHYGAVHLYTDEAGVHVVGQLWSFDIFRRIQDLQVTLRFENAAGDTVLVANTPAMLRTAVRNSQIPWHAVVAEADVADATNLSVSYFWSAPATLVPVGGLDVSPATLSGLTATGTVQNDGTVAATDVVVYGTMQSVDDFNQSEQEEFLDTAASTTIPSLAPGETAEYTITFSAAAQPGPVVEVVAETKSGPYMTSWENFFADLFSYAIYHDDIVWIAKEGIATGCAGGNFCPLRGVTRAQMATFLDRALGLPDTHVDYFTDDEGHWAEDSINRMAEAGITDGCGETTFCPTGRVNRGQMAKFLALGYDVPPSSVDAFIDDEHSTTEDYHNALAAAGFTKGCSQSGKYCANDPLLRQEMAAFIYRAEQLTAP